MLTTDEIRKFIDEDEASEIKRAARVGQDYYEGKHDILDYRMFYWNADGKLVEDKTRSNVRIPHPFFTELVDQGTQHILSGEEDIFQSDDTGLKKWLDLYFNKNRAFKAELSEAITGQQAKGFDYMYAYKGKDDRLCFESADCLGVVEVEGRFTDDGKDQRIWRYVDRIDKDGHTQWKILVIDDENTYFYRQTDEGKIEKDETVEHNPRPHAFYKDKKTGELFKKEFGFLPFFRLDMNKKRVGLLRAVKPLIDDYDLMASSLTNNLIDFDHPLHVVRGFQGNDLDELANNLKTKKMIGIPGEGGGVDIQVVDIPYQARQAKLDLDEKGIYKFGMGLNMEGLKDTSATTNIAIKAAYSLLELRCNKMKEQLEKFLEEIVTVVLDEINAAEGTAYTIDQVEFVFKPEIMSNAQENTAIELTDAQRRQTEVNTLLGLQAQLGDELMIKQVFEVLGLDYEEWESVLPKPEEDPTAQAQAALSAVVPEDEPIETPAE